MEELVDVTEGREDERVYGESDRKKWMTKKTGNEKWMEGGKERQE